MPTTYTHYSFGRDCIETMPKDIQKIIHENRDIYNIAVHGPDILFYNFPRPKVMDHGYKMHLTPAKVFFRDCKDIYDQNKNDQTLTYILGFLSHFVLDSNCHSYIERKIEVSGVSHFKLEAQWDRYAIILDNRTPNLVDRSESLKINRKTAKTIAQFYPFSASTILSSIKWQIFIARLLNSVSPRKQNALTWFFTKVLHDNKNPDLFMGFEELDKCKDSNIRLEKYRAKALKIYPKLMKNVLNYLDGKEKLDPYFEKDFDAVPNYKDIKVLPYEEEINYVVE